MLGVVVDERKRCSGCGRVLDPDEFSIKESDRYGRVTARYPACKKCRRLRVRIAAPRLDVAPFRGWLARRLADEGLWDLEAWTPVVGHHEPRSIEEVARDFGTSAKRVQDILKYRVETISEDYADRVLTAAGSPHLLSILWDPPAEDLAA